MKLIGNGCPSFLSPEQFKELLGCISVAMGCDDIRPVQYSPTPPSNTNLPWVQTDCTGGSSIGKVRHFKNGAWK